MRDVLTPDERRSLLAPMPLIPAAELRQPATGPEAEMPLCAAVSNGAAVDHGWLLDEIDRMLDSTGARPVIPAWLRRCLDPSRDTAPMAPIRAVACG